MHVVIFEDSRWHALAPLTLSRPVFTLATGMCTLLEKQVRHLRPGRLTLWVRPEQEAYCRERVLPTLRIPADVNRPLDDEPALLVNGRAVYSEPFTRPPHEAVAADDSGAYVHAAYLRSPGLVPDDALRGSDRWEKILGLPRMPPQARLADSLADLIHWNAESLAEDFTGLPEAAPKAAGPYHVVNDAEVWLGADARLEAGGVLDATRGPVVVAEGASVGANAVLQGPCYVGPHARVTPLALIRPGTSIGTMCRVGGEVADSVLMGFSNKAHEGYMGHSYVGRWVNLGAGTTTSNLKNTYGEISVQAGGRAVPTGRRFLGSLVGDHSKTGVLTRLSPGSYVGFYSMLAGVGPAPRFAPSFTFWGPKGAEPFRVDKAVEIARRVFARRDRPWTETDEAILRYAARVAPEVER